MVPKTTSETLKHKINPSLDQTPPQAVDVLLYTPGRSAERLMFSRIKNDTQCVVFIYKSKAKQIFLLYQSDFHFQVSLCRIKQFDLVFPQTCHWCCAVFLCDPTSMEKNRLPNQFCRNRPALTLFPSSVWLAHIFPHWTHPGQRLMIRVISSELGELAQTFVQGSEALNPFLCLLKALKATQTWLQVRLWGYLSVLSKYIQNHKKSKQLFINIWNLLLVQT